MDIFTGVHQERGVEQLYYPQHAVRRVVAQQIAIEASRFSPQVLVDVEDAIGGTPLAEDDPAADARLAAALHHHHLDGIVDAFVSGLAAEPATG